ncbi:DNA damage-regulated autophagy modulator protein 1-like isoform X2 [Penaeus japonicus]|uniref:DNA damage-regulated autophagy modulator protein 1-like isoform X2 n=1 Tax=Penaeus japonicus TaxID=27405 RepID=UPI001C71198B|nr:DNA damage-regulated autophagy modulator protein 1-like isoform X2 [Penaeus japonicus]
MGSGLAWLPFVTGSLLPFTFLITYIWSVVEGHVEPDFPYISATGNYPPESCFFGQMLNILAVLMAALVWVRHKIILDYCAKNIAVKTLPSRSRVASFFGYAASFGISLVGNFQAVMSYSLEPRVNSRAVSHLRVFCSFLASAMCVITVVFSYLHTRDNRDVAYWTSEHSWMRERNNWAYHVVATASEWVLAGTFYVVLLTLVPEFKRVTVQSLVVELDRDRRQVRGDDSTSTGRVNDSFSETVRL